MHDVLRLQIHVVALYELGKIRCLLWCVCNKYEIIFLSFLDLMITILYDLLWKGYYESIMKADDRIFGKSNGFDVFIRETLKS